MGHAGLELHRQVHSVCVLPVLRSVPLFHPCGLEVGMESFATPATESLWSSLSDVDCGAAVTSPSRSCGSVVPRALLPDPPVNATGDAYFLTLASAQSELSNVVHHSAQCTGPWPWVTALQVYAHSLSLSWFALLTASLLRLLLFGLRLKGGESNADCCIRGGRSLLRGANFSLLVFATLLCSTSAMPAFSADAPIEQEHLDFLNRLRIFDRDAQLVVSAHPVARMVEHSVGEAELPQFERGPPSPDVMTDDVGDEEAWKRMAVRVFSYGKADFFTSAWLKAGSSEQVILSSVADVLLIDREQLNITAVRPQTSDDTVDVILTPAWWQYSYITYFILDGSEVRRPTYMCTVPIPVTFHAIRAAVGHHLVDGIDIFLRNDPFPLGPYSDINMQAGDLLRLRFQGRVRVALPDLAEAFVDTAWSRDLDRLGLPRAPNPIGRVLLITHRFRCVIHVADDITSAELHSKIARMSRSTTEDLAFFVPRGEFEEPAYRGIPVSLVVAVYPREMLPPSDWTGVFVDARDVGHHFDFQVHACQELSPAEIADALDCELPAGFKACMAGYDDHAATPGRFICRPSCCLALWADSSHGEVDAGSASQPSLDSGDLGGVDEPCTPSVGRADRSRSRSPRRVRVVAKGNWWFDMQILLSEMQKSCSRCKVFASRVAKPECRTTVFTGRPAVFASRLAKPECRTTIFTGRPAGRQFLHLG